MPKTNPTTTPKSTPLEKLPAAPESIKKKKYALAFWKRVGGELVKVRTLTALHLEAFEMTCRVWHDYREACDWEEKNPDLAYYEGANGYFCEHPRIKNKTKSIESFLKLLAKFGLTPEAQGKLSSKDKSVAKKTPKNPMADFALKRFG